MLVEVTANFNKDISKIRDKKLLTAIRAALQHIEAAGSLTEIQHLKSWKGQQSTSGYG